MENINNEEQEPINMSAMLEEYLAMKKRYPKRPRVIREKEGFGIFQRQQQLRS